MEPIGTHDTGGGHASERAVLAKVVRGAADALGLDDAALARVLGVPEEVATRLRGGEHVLEPGSEATGMGMLLFCIYSGLDTIVGGDQASARSWLRGHNHALGGVPLDLIQREGGAGAVVAYLWARRVPA